MKNPKTKLKAKLKNKASGLFKDLCILKYGNKCELCNSDYMVTAHHFYYRSSCSHLTYDLDNGIILCCRCHSRLHFKDPKLVEDKIIEKRGKKWFNRLKKKAENPPKFYKNNIIFIETAIKKMEKLEVELVSKELNIN